MLYTVNQLTLCYKMLNIKQLGLLFIEYIIITCLRI